MKKFKRDSYEARQAKRKAEQADKKRTMKSLLRDIDKATATAVESDAYHEGDIEALNRAHSAVMAVLGGFTKRVRR